VVMRWGVPGGPGPGDRGVWRRHPCWGCRWWWRRWYMQGVVEWGDAEERRGVVREVRAGQTMVGGPGEWRQQRWGKKGQEQVCPAGCGGGCHPVCW
jgi:hypothetical protein